MAGTNGTHFVVGLGAHERSDTIYQAMVKTVQSGVQYKAWLSMRRPFLLPPGLSGHICDQHWEKFDIDKAACRVCSKLHVCSSRTCPCSDARDGIICTVTGLFLGQHLVDQYDFPKSTENAFSPTTSKKPGVFGTTEIRPIEQSDLDNVTRVVANILTSSKTQASISTETEKLMNKIRSIALRQMRTYRLSKRVPNLCEIDTYLFSQLAGHRVPPQSVMSSMEERNECIRSAAIAICRLLHFMRTYCRNIPSCVRAAAGTGTSTTGSGGIAVGMLYLMRSGVTIDSITVLPRMPRLKHILPLEQHLPTFFRVRAKVVTEAENVIKYNMRSVDAKSLALLAQTQCIVRS